MKILRALVALVCLFIISSCEKSSSSNESTSPAAGSDANASGNVVVSGSLALPDGHESSPELGGRLIELQNESGNTLATAYSNDDGTYNVVVGALAVAKSNTASLLGGFRLHSVIDDDSSGKVLAIDHGVDFSAVDLTKSKLEVGTTKFAEISAIRGRVRFVSPDGSENAAVSRLGVEVYIPGFSFYARTDRDGRFLILYIPAGEYSLRVEKGLFSRESAVTVIANTTLDMGDVDVPSDTEKPLTSATLDSTDFRNPICVSLSASEAANTYYTVDNSTPVVSDAFKYSSNNVTTCGSRTDCPICIRNSTTLKYFSVDLSGNTEEQKSKFYYYNDRWADPEDKSSPTVSIKAGGSTVGNLAQHTQSYEIIEVELEANEGADIWYTLSSGSATPPDPSVSTSARKRYVSPIRINSTSTIAFYAVDYARNASVVSTHKVEIFNWTKLTSLPEAVEPGKSRLVYSPKLGTAVLIAQTKEVVPTKTRVYVYNPALSANSRWIKISDCAITTGLCPKVRNPLNQSTESGSRFIWAVGVFEGSSSSPDKLFATTAMTYASGNATQSVFSLALPTAIPTSEPGSMISWALNDADFNQDGNLDAGDSPVPTDAELVSFGIPYYDRHTNSMRLIDAQDLNSAYFNSLHSSGVFQRMNPSIDASSENHIQAEQPYFMCWAVIQPKAGQQTSSTAKLFLFGESHGAADTTTMYDYVNRTEYHATAPVWTSQRHTTYPSNFHGCGASYDPEKNIVLSFGGGATKSNSSPYVFSDLSRETWVYENTSGSNWNWRQVYPQASPAPRYLAAIAFIPELNGHMLVGGVSPTTATANEVWIFGK